MYSLVFWDLVPTGVEYKYYSATKAGFWVYKTPEQRKEKKSGFLRQTRIEEYIF